MQNNDLIIKDYDEIEEISGYPKIPLGKAEDLRKKKFNRLQPLYRTVPLTDSQRCAFWLCKCDCGNYYITRTSSLKNGSTQSCGCYNREESSKRRFVDITNQRFGRLTAIKLIENPNVINKNRRYWLCKCDCGNLTIVNYSCLATGKTVSCGCYQKEITRELGKTALKDLTGQNFGKLTVVKRDLSPNLKRVHWICQCECGNVVSVAANALTTGRTVSCGCYGSSKGEQIISNLLTENSISFKKEVSFPKLKDKKNLRFDFGIYNYDTLNYLIEYDGIQHFKITGGHSTQKQLDLTQYHDNLKTQWCKENNIPLIRIPYWHYDDLCLEDLLLETTQFRAV